MSTKLDKILMFGATGAIGKDIITALINAMPSFSRLAIFTSPSTLDKKAALINVLKEPGVEIIAGDIRNEAQVLEAYEGFDTVVSALGRNCITDQIQLLKLAEQTSNIKRFFPSEYGTDIEYGPASASEKPHQQKLKVRAYIKDNIKRLEYTYLVTGPYADMYIADMKVDPRVGSFDFHAKKAVLLGTGEEKVSLTTMADTGKLVVAAITHPEASRNRALKVNSFTTTPAEILSEFEKQTGGEQWEVSYTPLPKLKELEEEAWKQESPLATMYTLKRIWTEGGTLYERRDNADIGMEKGLESLSDVVEKVIRSKTTADAGGK